MVTLKMNRTNAKLAFIHVKHAKEVPKIVYHVPQLKKEYLIRIQIHVHVQIAFLKLKRKEVNNLVFHNVIIHVKLVVVLPILVAHVMLKIIES
jgi:hypothetical protein